MAEQNASAISTQKQQPQGLMNAKDIKGLMSSGVVKNKFAEILGKNANSFISSITTLATTTALKDCEPNSVLACAITAATLNLHVNPSFGFAAIIPYNSQNGKVAQFQIMSKGLIQLAIRTGLYESINVRDVREGEIVKHDFLSGDIEFKILETNRESAKIIGYVSYFKLLTGFKSTLYMTIAEIEAHAKKFSKTYSSPYGAWKTNFEGMAKKTVLKLNLSRYAPMSVEMLHAVEADQAVMKTDETFENIDFSYVDSDFTSTEPKALDLAKESIDKATKMTGKAMSANSSFDKEAPKGEQKEMF